MRTDYFPYQLEGAVTLSRQLRFGLFDEMGLGKTAQVINALNLLAVQLGRTPRAVIVCPAMLRAIWLQEFKQWGDPRFRVLKGQSMSEFGAWANGRFDIICVSYELATKWSPYFLQNMLFMDVLALDEGHACKNITSNRSKAIFGPDFDGAGGLASMAQQTWNVTGTPMVNAPLDIYPHLKMSGMIPGMSLSDFAQEFFDVSPGRYSARCQATPENAERVRGLLSMCSLRRTVESVGLELPPMLVSGFPVDGNAHDVLQLLREHPGLTDTIMCAVNDDAGRGLSVLDAAHIMTLRRLIGEAKAVPYAHLLAHELHSGKDRVVVVGQHTKTLRTVYDHLSSLGFKCALVDGSTPERQRISAVAQFQNKELHAFIGNMRVMGSGTTLHAARYIDILEPDWAPLINTQALKRIHRIGQIAERCFGRFITLANTFDEQVTELIVRKARQIGTIDDTGVADIAALRFKQENSACRSSLT